MLVQHNLRRNTFEQSEEDRRVFRKFDYGELKTVMFVHMDDILAHAQETIERFAAELEGIILREADDGEIRRQEGKADTSFFGGANPFFK